MRRIGIFRPRIEGRMAGTADEHEADFGIALDFSGTGRLERRDTDEVQWTIAPSEDGDVWGWTVGDQLLLGFTPMAADAGLVAALIQLQGRARATAVGRQRADLPLLLVTGWYLMAARQFDLIANPPVP